MTPTKTRALAFIDLSSRRQRCVAELFFQHAIPHPQSSSSFPGCAKTNAARLGAGTGLSGPRTERQIISFNSKSSAASSFLKFIFCDFLLPQAVIGFFSVRSIFAGSAVYGVKSGVVWNDWNIGKASASNCDIGFNPRINSIVRSMLLVE